MIIPLIAAACFAGVPGFAGNDYATGVAEYNAHHYKVALGYFANAARANPRDYNSYYYLGLCYQGLNQMTMARQNFEWVARSCPNPTLRTQAMQAASQIADHAAANAARQQTGSGLDPGYTVALTMQQAAPAANSGPKITGRLQVVEWYTDT
jgi:tetratricopeptide (TPR) repeat protein